MVVNIVEVHNVYSVHELDDEGNPVKESLLIFFRPQDWGNSVRWFYNCCKVEVEFEGTLYVNHCHLWQNIERNSFEAAKAVAPYLFDVTIPGSPREECDRSHLKEDDFWDESWGAIPPEYDRENWEPYYP